MTVSLREWEPNGTCYIRTIEGDLIRVKLIKDENNILVKWESVPPFPKEYFDVKRYKTWMTEISED